MSTTGVSKKTNGVLGPVSAEEVAILLGGANARPVLQQEKRQGQRSCVRIFSIADPLTGKTGISRFVEKTTPARHEYLVAAASLRASHSDRALLRWPGPRCLRVEHGDSGFLIYQEYLEGVGGGGADRGAPDLAPRLAAAIHQLNESLACLLQDDAFRTRGVSILRRRAQSLLRQFAGPLVLGRIRESLRRVHGQLDHHPLVMSHNDLHWGNIAIQGSASDPPLRIAFIDFGSVAWNYPGADLHHFASACDDDDSERSELAQQFFDRLSWHYAQLSHVPVDVVRAAAYGYASHRGFLRLDTDPRGPEMAFISALGFLQRAEEALGLRDRSVGVLALFKAVSEDAEQARGMAALAEGQARRLKQRCDRLKKRLRKPARCRRGSSTSAGIVPGGWFRVLVRTFGQSQSTKPNEPGSLG